MINFACNWELNIIEKLLNILSHDKTQYRKTCIVCKSVRSKSYYYKVTRENGKQKKQYLGKSTSHKVLKLAESNYKAVLKKTLLYDEQLLRTFISKFKPFDYSAIMTKLSPSLQDLSIPDPADELLSSLHSWGKETYTKNPHPMPDYAIYAKDGTKVRSRIECIIYNALLDAGIPFHYDPLLEFNTTDRYGNPTTVLKSPDFLIKCLDGSYIILEHAGLLDDDSYVDNLTDKIRLYHSNGFTLGDNFFITSDDHKKGINTQAIDMLVILISWKVYGINGYPPAKVD